MTNLAAPIGAVTTPTAAPDRGLDMKRVQLAHGNIVPGSSLLVELIKHSGPDAHPTVLVTWPRVSEVSPARFAEVVSNAASRQCQHRASPPAHHAGATMNNIVRVFGGTR